MVFEYALHVFVMFPMVMFWWRVSTLSPFWRSGLAVGGCGWFRLCGFARKCGVRFGVFLRGRRFTPMLIKVLKKRIATGANFCF